MIQSGAFLNCNNLTKRFGTGHASQTVLHGINLDFRLGECCALVGPSGSGKTTLLSILGCLAAPTHGQVTIGRKRVDFSAQSELCRLRRQSIGYVFQHAKLLPFLSVEENLRIVGQNARIPNVELQQRIERGLTALELAQHRHRRPDSLSGGEQQRLAVARALLHDPELILADEPTGALDSHHGKNVMRLLTEQARQGNALLITVTHDLRVLSLFDRVIRIDSGRIIR